MVLVTGEFLSMGTSGLPPLGAGGPELYSSVVGDFPHSPVGKESVCNAGDLGSIPGLGRLPGEGNGNPLHYSCLGNPMDRGAWWAIVPGVTKNQTRLSK